jgi:hypothetical protein
MFCGCPGHLDEFCFHHKRVEKRCFEYNGNSYRDEFLDFPPRSYSHASSRASSHALSRFSHGPNYRSYDFCSREIIFVSRHFGYGHILIVVIIFQVGLVFLLEGLTLNLSRDTCTVHIFPVVVHVPLGQMVRYKEL